MFTINPVYSNMVRFYPVHPFKSLLLFSGYCLTYCLFFLSTQTLPAQTAEAPVPDIQCVYAESELRDLFMGHDLNRYLDDQLVELLYGSCPVPTPKAALIYLHIRSAMALRRYESGNQAMLTESLAHYRMILDRQYWLANLALEDPDFVLEYRRRLAELGSRVEPGYIDTFSSAPAQMNTRGQAEYLVSRSGQPLDPAVRMVYEDGRTRQPLTPVMSATYGVSRGSQPAMSAMSVDLLTGEDVSTRSAKAYASGARTTAIADPWGMTRGAAPADASARSAITPVQSYNLRTRAALRDAESRYSAYQQAASTYSRGSR